MRIFRSLLAKYMLIILLAMSIVQIAYFIPALFVMGIAQKEESNNNIQYGEDYNENVIEEQWHAEANKIKAIKIEVIEQLFEDWQQKYPEAAMFWVSEKGTLLTEVNVKEQLPAQWTPAFTTKFIKERYDGDPFTVIAYLGDDETNGFIVFEIPRSVLNPPIRNVYQQYGTIVFLGVICIIIFFISVSFLFFRGIRKRLLKLQEAMEIRDVDGLPIGMDVKKKDEIGQLEQSFNRMVCELRESKNREQKEEQLRRELIANLSHDLRTPLTKVRAQTYSISKEKLSDEGKYAVKALETSIVNIDGLMENLMSYTLLMASKYKFEPKETNVIRFAREHMTTWYPVFEKEGFEIDVELHSFEDNNWLVDSLWLGRIFDNFFQNVLRHASSGQYIGVKTESTKYYDAFVISDCGKGMNNESNAKGAGIGLSIVDIMVKGMELDWDITSSESGTMIKIIRRKKLSE
ncbi:HAMP domain-containing histidine kinase [Solibacillus sp. MA9]|uniref:histidine kinase n=1 Tax=Solibacillus palustris TaxID=2908203 RepID=A0ABS9UFA5_9BACL|nr:HAMP domain-containing histidine kinase [Solibacillus sp. MA9]MCH7322948.1 HAMP domain-containing histidine kinase [Solibacillus sp. MA9]